ncbi:MAG: CHAT domain-containing protein [Anaerolinea sp.]|nr:CHAT domain-containing protein [Anaerolinea sp.]
MDERPTTLNVVNVGSIFRFTVTKPDQILNPKMEQWGVEVQPTLITGLCQEMLQCLRDSSAKSLNESARREIIDLGNTLYRQLLLPRTEGDLLRTIAEGAVIPLLISGDSEMVNIPWELLHDGQDFLGVHYPVGRQLLSRPGTPVAAPWSGGEMRCLLIADPLGDLEDARREAQTLQKWLTDRKITCHLLMGAEAKSTSVLVKLTRGNYHFIHYSGHVALDEKSRQKHYNLILHDGHLSSVEIGKALGQNSPVVVLNGCDTASVDGLADAFINGGAQLVVGSLYEVPDAGAGQWAERFYEGLLRGLPAGESLRLARQSLWTEGRFPLAGLAFVMYGNPCLQLFTPQSRTIDTMPVPSVRASLLDRILESLSLQRQDFDNACLNVLESSLKYAGDIGNVSSVHLFTAMLEGPDSRLRDYLLKKEIDPADIRKGFEKTLRVMGMMRQMVASDDDKNDDVEPSDSVIQVLKNAKERARQAKRGQASFEDLLIAFSSQRTSVSHILKDLNVDLRDLVRSLEPDSPRPTRVRPVEPSPEAAPTPPLPPESELPLKTRGIKRSTPAPAPSKVLPTKRARTATRYTEVEFPAEAAQGTWHTLRVSILAAQRSPENKPLPVEMPANGGSAQVSVCVSAPGFEAESNSPLQGHIEVVPDQDSEVLEFRLRAKNLGNQAIRVDFLQDGRYIGTVTLPVDVVAEARATKGSAQSVGQPVFEQTGAPPDLTILIAHQPLPGGRVQLRFTLHSHLPQVGVYHRDVGEVTLHRAPDQWFEEVLNQIDLAYRGGSGAERKLRRLGNTLWDQLTPEAFKSLYWRTRDHIQTIQIVTDDPWILWEMLRPYRETDEGSEEDKFLCERFALTRWLRGAPPMPQIRLHESRVLGASPSESPLPAALEEIQFVGTTLAGAGIHAIALEPRKEQLLDQLEHGGFDHLHIASHGGVSPAGGDLGAILLADGELSPLEISGQTLRFGRDHPLVFVNACQSGQLGASLTRLGGWAERFLSAGCSAFVGALFPVTDESALRFSQVFYTELCGGKSVAESCRGARAAIRDSGDPTWIAYALYADPHAKAVIEPVEAAEGDSPQGEKLTLSSAAERAVQHGAQRAVQIGLNHLDSTLFFEGLLTLPEGAVAVACNRLGVPLDKLLGVFQEVNDKGHPPAAPLQPPAPGEPIRIRRTQSVHEIFKLGEDLALAAQDREVSDQHLLEGFVLHRENTAIRVLVEVGLQPELLLSRAFEPNGALDQDRFSEHALSILNEALDHAQYSRNIGSPQIAAALANAPGKLLQQTFRQRKIDLKAYLKERAPRIKVFEDRPVPQAVAVSTCSPNARRILNLAELLARIERTEVSEAELVRAYILCQEQEGK